jgi:hypothetical protein
MLMASDLSMHPEGIQCVMAARLEQRNEQAAFERRALDRPGPWLCVVRSCAMRWQQALPFETRLAICVAP